MTQLGLTLVVMTALLLSMPSCGKKGDPFLPGKGFDARVTDLEAELQESSILLGGSIVFSDMERTQVTGSRVYFAEYPAESQPCEGCPIEYQGYRSFGPEVVRDRRFSCRISNISPDRVYFFKVVLVGQGDIQGPPSASVRVAAE